MTERAQPKKGLWPAIWIAIRFVTFGVGGFVALLRGSSGLLDFLEPISPHDPRSWMGLPLALVGGLMMLFGAGVWRRWAYLWVFFSLLIVLCSIAIRGEYVPNWWHYVPDEKSFGIILFAVPMVLSYWAVKRYYKQREAALPSSVPASQIAKNQEVNQ
jgi:hypothetical protein